MQDNAIPGSMSFKIGDECIGCGACDRVCPENAIKGEKKVRFDIDSFLCMGCGTCFNTCPSGAIIDAQGNHSPRKGKQKVTKRRINPDLCAGCLTCFLNCPQKAITVIKRGIFSGEYCRVDEESCVGCGICAKYCIIDAVESSRGR